MNWKQNLVLAWLIHIKNKIEDKLFTFNWPVRPAGLSGTTFFTNIPNIVSVDGDSDVYRST